MNSSSFWQIDVFNPGAGHYSNPGLMSRMLAVLLLATASLCADAAESLPGDFAISQQALTFVDKSRSTPAAFEFAGSDERRLDVLVWYPAGVEGPRPLVIYSHGTYGTPDGASHLAEHLASHGYVVAAPAFPLTSRVSHTGIPGADISDTPNQPGDLAFVIEQLLGHSTLGASIDGGRVACMGHSLGAVTCYFASFGSRTHVPVFTANVLLGAGDPVQAALASDFGFDGVGYNHKSVPTLFVSASRDVFAGLGGRPYAAFSRIEPPKYELMLQGGTHVWFTDNAEKPADGRNPDCLFFERSAPGMLVPGCEQRGDLMHSAVQKTITRNAVLAFLDAYLRKDAGALDRLKALDDDTGDVGIRFQE